MRGKYLIGQPFNLRFVLIAANMNLSMRKMYEFGKLPEDPNAEVQKQE